MKDHYWNPGVAHGGTVAPRLVIQGGNVSDSALLKQLEAAAQDLARSGLVGYAGLMLLAARAIEAKS